MIVLTVTLNLINSYKPVGVGEILYNEGYAYGCGSEPVPQRVSHANWGRTLPNWEK